MIEVLSNSIVRYYLAYVFISTCGSRILDLFSKIKNNGPDSLSVEEDSLVRNAIWAYGVLRGGYEK